MALLIGQACSNEKSEITGKTEIIGGKKGDQTGREVRINTFYDGQVWQAAYRCKDKAKAKLIGQYMADACRNNYIGYDAGETRYTCWDLAMAIKSVKNINVSCNTDCSQLMTICVNLAGIPLTKYLWTAIEDELLMSTGMFTRITDQEMLRGNGLQVGDILWRSGHTAVVVEADEQPSGADKTPKWVGMTFGAELIDVYAEPAGTENLRTYPKLALGNLFDVCDEENGRWYIRITDQFGTVHYGWISKTYCLRVTSQYSVTVSTDLHLRANAGTNFKSLAVMPRGARVKYCDQKPAKDGKPWAYVIYNGQSGFASARYLE